MTTPATVVIPLPSAMTDTDRATVAKMIRKTIYEAGDWVEYYVGCCGAISCCGPTGCCCARYATGRVTSASGEGDKSVLVVEIHAKQGNAWTPTGESVTGVADCFYCTSPKPVPVGKSSLEPGKENTMKTTRTSAFATHVEKSLASIASAPTAAVRDSRIALLKSEAAAIVEYDAGTTAAAARGEKTVAHAGLGDQGIDPVMSFFGSDGSMTAPAGTAPGVALATPPQQVDASGFFAAEQGVATGPGPSAGAASAPTTLATAPAPLAKRVEALKATVKPEPVPAAPSVPVVKALMEPEATPVVPAAVVEPAPEHVWSGDLGSGTPRETADWGKDS